MNRRSLSGLVSVALAFLLSTRCGSSSGGSGSEESGDAGDSAVSSHHDGASGSGTGPSSGSGSGDSSGSGSGSGTGAGTGSGSGSGSSSPPGSGSGSGTGSGTAGTLSVLQRGNDIYRRATFTEPGLLASSVSTMAPDTTFNTNATFPANGNEQNQGTASVLYLENGPAAAGCPTDATGCKATTRAANAGEFFAFPALGANPNVVAIDETTGNAVWTAHLTTGGDGVRGTPAVDPATRRLFVVTGNNPHLVHALSVDNGVEATTGGWPITLSTSTLTYKTIPFNSSAQNQHGALLFLNDILYIPFGGEFGDGGNYVGWVVAINTATPSQVAAWATQSPRSGVWGSGGLASDGTYVFGVTGDTTNEPRSTSDSQEVFRLKGMAEFSRDEASVFVPTEWQSWDRPAGDLDFGASTPAFVPLPAGSNPPSLLVAPAKAGRIYVLNGADLSAGSYPTPGGSLAELVVSSTTSEAVYTAATIYSSASGLHATINVGEGAVNCPGGNPSGNEAIVSILLQPNKTPAASAAWCAANSAGGSHLNYPPISTTSDGVSADPLVWFMNGSQLEALDGDTGHAVVTTTGAACDAVPSMSFPIAVKNRIVVAALGHLCSWSPGGH